MADAARDSAIETRIRQALDLGRQGQPRLAPPRLDNRRPHRFDGSLRKQPAGGANDD
ncbi:hypothetical protein O7627_32610 [Solwaraspora sp. WMMD1047]|uniref:hypothetical protein n=1 Tax=Solwaraspora sp. WMMD1047 TaxID=3016102 RepID=UPI002417476B|nr:hypothetical protein [Solwaraspora sp. WMMD1047]MDG4834012.1 hypothetical protein [Solwaraspora sp. WMMD1047]